MGEASGKFGRARRIEHLKQSEIRRMTRECQRVGGINLGQGICDLPTPPEVLRSASEAILADRSTYSKFEGVDELRRAVAEKSERYNQIPGVDPDSEVVVTVGATGALVAIAQALLNPGDEVVLFEPYYGYHVNTLRAAGCAVRLMTLKPGESVSAARIEAVCSERTRAILFSNPTNPSGKVWTRSELADVARVCRERDLIAVTDEIYEYIVYSGAQHISLAALDGMRERTITISGFSKTFSITGWRIGTIVAPAALAEPIGLVNDLYYVCAPTPLQYGVAAGMAALNESYYAEMAADYEAKRDLFCASLQSAGLDPLVPDGAYYVLADASRLGERDARAASMRILDEVGVASVPGSAFYESEAGERLVRFCYAKEWDVLREACRRIERLS